MEKVKIIYAGVGLTGKIRTTAPIKQVITDEGIKLYIKPRGYPEMRVKPTINPNNFFDKSKEYYLKIKEG